MTREEAIKLLECSATELVGTMMQTDEQTAVNQLQRYVDAFDVAISALREQDNRTESDTVKGCDYCQKFDDPCGVPMIASEEDDCDRGIYLYNGYLCANGGSFCDAKVQFCPMCGRRLEEA